MMMTLIARCIAAGDYYCCLGLLFLQPCRTRRRSSSSVHQGMHCLNAGVGGQANGPLIPSGGGQNGSAGNNGNCATAAVVQPAGSSSSGGSILIGHHHHHHQQQQQLQQSQPSNNIGLAAGGAGIGGGGGAACNNIGMAHVSNGLAPGSGSGGGGESVILGVVRALGVLVCEGRIQGPPRGYKEGPHCLAPLQHNNHQCEKDNYLCDRYLVLVREIRERVDIGSYICVEVVLCSDCPCGLAKSKCKKRVISSVPPTTPWQHVSEMLLEYWCIGIVQSKNPESMMNSQGLYQAVRSRLHFSQVAAWWSRTQGARPSYIATRLVPSHQGVVSNDEHLKRFSEKPVEHTFPLANLNDGHYVQVTMWALPRMEDIPVLQCPKHGHQHQQEEQRTTVVDGCPHASTPSKHLIPSHSNDTGNVVSTSSDIVLDSNDLQMPALVDDRLLIDCDQHGKHLCQCPDDEEDVHEIPTSPAAAAAAAALVRPNGERKRRRSLPCRPPEPAATAVAPGSGSNSPVLPKLQESVQNTSTNNVASSPPPAESFGSLEGLERSFRTQLSIEDQQECCGNQEKRYKRSESTQDNDNSEQQKQQQQQQVEQGSENNKNVPLLIPWLSYSANGHAQASSLPIHNNNNSYKRNNMNLVVNPFYSCQNFDASGKKVRGRSAEPELIIHGEQQYQLRQRQQQQQNQQQSWNKAKESSSGSSKLDQRVLDWISSQKSKDGFTVVSNNCELDNPKTTVSNIAHMSGGSTTSSQAESDVLKLSPREVEEVIAVLKTKVPGGRRRSGLRTGKRRERYAFDSKSLVKDNVKEDGSVNSNVSNNKADILMSAILRSSSKESNSDRKGLTDISNGTRVPILPDMKVSKAFTTTMKTPIYNGRSESDSKSNILSNDCDDTSIPSAINKKILKLKQKLFTRDPSKFTLLKLDNEYNSPLLEKRDSRVKRRIDFSQSNVNVSEDDKEVNESIKSNHYCCDSSVGTTPRSAHVNTITHSTKNDINSNDSSKMCLSYNCGSSKVKQEKPLLSVESYEEKSKRKNKNRGKHDLSPIWMSHKNNNDDKIENGCAGSESDGYDKTIVPSAKDQERFRRSLENAASMVFHSRTGLPLTSSPAPLRRGHCCFDFDSSLNSVSSKRSALFELNTPPSPGAVSLEEADKEAENVCDIEEVTRRRSNSRNRPQSHALLGSFEESALNGRLEPVSTVHGFTAEIGASGAFCPNHRKLPVTVFFYTLGDNDKVSSPYLAHINLGKKGYQVPRSGTIQVTLLNPYGTVVKMFVVQYDLTDMPVRSHTFLRQRTLRDKTLRYLIHLRFMSGKSGRIYLHTDVRMIICRKADVDTASDFGSEPPKELRSYIHGPTNPKFSPRC